MIMICLEQQLTAQNVSVTIYEITATSFFCLWIVFQDYRILYSSVSQTVVRGPHVVLGFCPYGPIRLNISQNKTEKIKLT